MKILFVVLDGAAEPPGEKSALETATKPNLDFLTRHSYCGMWIPTIPEGYNIKSLSEIGILQLLGYNPEESPGRGYLEALGIGLSAQKDTVYMRANFATVDGKMNIVDRRAGRDD